MLPGLVLGLALYVFYIVTNIGLARTLPGMVIGHVLVTVPYVIGTVSAALYNFDVSLEDAARSLGAGPVRVSRDHAAQYLPGHCGRIDLRVRRLLRPVRHLAVLEYAEHYAPTDRPVQLAAL